MLNEIWNTSQIWISFQNESVRLESDLKNSIMALPYLSIPSSICVEMLKFGTFCHFQKAHRAPDWFVSLSNLPKIKGLGALCKISLSTQDVRKWLILGMNVHYHLHHLVNSSPMFSISILCCWGAKWCSEYITTQWGYLLNPFHHMLYEIGKTTLQNSDFIKIWNVIQIWISFQNESVRLESDL